MASNLAGVGGNAFEDFTDDFTTTVVMRQAKKVFDPLKKGFEGSDSAFDEAMQSAIMTLQMGISMYALNFVNSRVVPALMRRAELLFVYFIGGKLAKNVGGRIKKFKYARNVSKALNIFSDSDDNRARVLGSASSLVNHLDIMEMHERKISNDSRIGMDKTFTKAKTSYDQKALTLYTEKTKTGTWTKSKQDKKIYQKATGAPLPAGVSWSKMVEKLNSFQEFAKTSENEIVNRAQVEFDRMVADGKSRITS